MATLTQSTTAVKAPRKPRTVKPPHGTVGATVRISGTRYDLKPVRPDAGSGVARCFALAKLDDTGEVYHTAQHDTGECSCTCPSFVWDHADHELYPACKHLAAMGALGLIDLPTAEGDPASWPAWTDAHTFAC